jgi:hypothetical protein
VKAPGQTQAEETPNEVRARVGWAWRGVVPSTASQGAAQPPPVERETGGEGGAVWPLPSLTPDARQDAVPTEADGVSTRGHPPPGGVKIIPPRPEQGCEGHPTRWPGRSGGRLPPR